MCVWMPQSTEPRTESTGPTNWSCCWSESWEGTHTGSTKLALPSIRPGFPPYRKLEVLELLSYTSCNWLWHTHYFVFFSSSLTEALVTRRCPEDVLSTGTSTYQTCPSELGGSVNSGFQSLGSFKRLQINKDFEASQPPPMCKYMCNRTLHECNCFCSEWCV